MTEKIPEPEYNPLQSPIQLTIKELLTGSLSREGELQSLEIQGEVSVKCLDPKRLGLAIVLDSVKGLNGRPNPNIDRALFSQEGTLQAKKGAFPLNQNVPALKYKI